MSAGENAHARWVEEALRKHEGPLVQYATRLLGDADAARDVVQDAFLRLCEQDRSAVEGHLAPWLYRVCRNRAMDALRRRRVTPKTNSAVLDGRAEGTSPPSNPDAAAEERDAATVAVAALSTLPEAQQEVLRLKLRHGLAYREIAEVTGLTVNHVGVLIHEGMKTLRRRLSVPASTLARDGGAR